MKTLLRALVLFAALISPAFAAPYYQPTANMTALANYGAASPLVAHAFVEGKGFNDYQVGPGNFDWVAGTCTPNARTVFAATGVPTSGAGSGCWFLNMGPQYAGRLTVGSSNPDQNLPGGFSPSLITGINDNGGYTPFAAWSYGATAPIGWEFYKARCTADAPCAIQFGDPLIDFGGRGYDGTTFQGSNVAIVTSAAENWGPGARGTIIQLATTQNGGTARTKWAELTDAGHWSTTAFIGAGMATLDGIHNQVPVTYFHARGLNQSTNGFVKLQDDFHTAASLVAFQTYFDSADTRVGWTGFNAGTNGTNWVFNNEQASGGGGFQFRSTSGVIVDMNQYGLGVGRAPASGDALSAAGLIRSYGSAGGFQQFNTGAVGVSQISTRQQWGDGASQTDAAIAAYANMYFYTNGSTTAKGSLSTAGVLNITAGYSSNGTAGVSCSGAPTAGFTTVLGIVTAC